VGPVSDHPPCPADAARVIGRIEHELQLLLAERAAIQKRIRVIKDLIAGLAEVFGADIINGELEALLQPRSARRANRSHPGITGLCRQILKESSEPLTARQICDMIQEKSPSVLIRTRKPTATLSVVLGRLVSYGEAESSQGEGSERIWRWCAGRQ
jgi:hypothetical protein